ncbi:hypothetical protein CERSUDRAFT_117768 [Gelatoporia subvermispora B]|uniref:Ricin B lectin domain-containing protein n=1 Tax=Ceriporiopsis subvermispora (strain B) TaxID=914234 RepID=M2PD49_CERS8|nr:hypothetical protein CERSUDRAFT_117768 [Gelatoporia subvermispora B]
MSSQVIANGTYFIFGAQQGTRGTALEFEDGTDGENLTSWQYTGDANQQWKVAGDSSTLTFQNVMSSLYISFTPTSSGRQYITASKQPFQWFAEEIDGTFSFSNDSTFAASWNIDGGGTVDNTPVIVYQSITPFTIYSTAPLGIDVPGSPSSSGGGQASSSGVSGSGGGQASSSGVSGSGVPAPSNSNTASGGGKHADTGAIVGGTVGAILAAIAIGLALWGLLQWRLDDEGWTCCWRQRRPEKGKPTGWLCFRRPVVSEKAASSKGIRAMALSVF